MALSTFDGEPQVREHYDPAGNLTGTTVIPGWTDEDRAWALGLALADTQRCAHGHNLSESSSDEWSWVTDSLVCLACVALDAAAQKDKDLKTARAKVYTLQKVPSRRKRRRR